VRAACPAADGAWFATAESCPRLFQVLHEVIIVIMEQAVL
jgi:hypothetical protein